MRRSVIFASALAGSLVLAVVTARAGENPKADFGLFIAEQLRAHSEQLFGFTHPLRESVLGPYGGAENTKAIDVAHGLTVSLVSSAVASATDQIAMWPDDENPTHLFVC